MVVELPKKSKNGLITYKTGLVATSIPGEIKASFPGRGWQAGFIPYKPIGKASDIRPAKGRYSRLVITAKNLDTALHAAYLIPCAMTLYTGSLFDVEQHVDKDGWALEWPYFASFVTIGRPGIPEAAKIAAKASQKSKWKNALTRYWASHKICSMEWETVWPGTKAAYAYMTSNNALLHALFAQTITVAYGVIEELNLQMEPKKRVAGERPTYRQPNNAWTTGVIQSLNHRLKGVGLHTDSRLIWLRRGPDRGFDRAFPPSLCIKTNYCDRTVRDYQTDLANALFLAAKLRSAASAHKFNPHTRSLMPHDVFNVQNLARSLLLGAMGFKEYAHPQHELIKAIKDRTNKA